MTTLITSSSRHAPAQAHCFRLGWPAIAMAPLMLPLVAVQAQPAPPTAGAPATAPAASSPAQLAPVEITGRHYDNAVGSSEAASQGRIRAELLESRPALRPGEVLEFVPGVIVTQHSGDGKANQYFLRGFNLDHGTDFATSVAGMPVNLPSHGHGQGYADLNFLIPELVDHIDYRKGPYFAQNGDFAAAGSADIAYRTRLDRPFATLTLGEHRYRRLVGGASLALGAGEGAASGDPAAASRQLTGVVEVQGNDGPWTVPEGLRKQNAVFTLSDGGKARGWSASLMTYQAQWTATDQIPARLIEAGSHQGQPFGRFDSLDPTDGGRTHRHSLSAEWHREAGDSSTRVSAYAIDYGFALWSNFTFAMERPATGDQFAQQDDRRILGGSASHAIDHGLLGLPARSEVGLQWRRDQVRVGLFNTQARVRLPVDGTVREDELTETSLGLYGQTSVEFTPWLRGIAGLRADRARFEVRGLSDAANTGQAADHQLSPKLSFILGPWQRTEFFLNTGRGHHSNDARGVTAAIDPAPGLVAARGSELGLRSEWIPGLQTSLALWRLAMDSELVYVGDAGVTEANRPSTRRGLEWNNRWTSNRGWLVDADMAWTHARFADADPAGDRIPNAVDKVGSLAVTLGELGPWSASLQWRYLGSGALIEDNSVRSRPSVTTNLRLARQLTPRVDLSLDVFNLFNRKVNDIEYFYESQLPGETAPVADRHLHPAEPRTLRLSLRLAL